MIVGVILKGVIGTIVAVTSWAVAAVLYLFRVPQARHRDRMDIGRYSSVLFFYLLQQKVSTKTRGDNLLLRTIGWVIVRTFDWLIGYNAHASSVPRRAPTGSIIWALVAAFLLAAGIAAGSCL